MKRALFSPLFHRSILRQIFETKKPLVFAALPSVSKLTLCGTLFLAVLTIAGCMVSNEAKVSQNITHGGLSCFTITPSAGPELPPSCDALCGQQGAVCSGVTSNLSPPPSCEAAAVSTTCRCCKVSP